MGGCSLLASLYKSFHRSLKDTSDSQAVTCGNFCQFLAKIVSYGAYEMDGEGYVVGRQDVAFEE